MVVICRGGIPTESAHPFLLALPSNAPARAADFAKMRSHSFSRESVVVKAATTVRKTAAKPAAKKPSAKTSPVNRTLWLPNVVRWRRRSPARAKQPG